MAWDQPFIRCCLCHGFALRLNIADATGGFSRVTRGVFCSAQSVCPFDLFDVGLPHGAQWLSWSLMQRAVLAWTRRYRFLDRQKQMYESRRTRISRRLVFLLLLFFLQKRLLYSFLNKPPRMVLRFSAGWRTWLHLIKMSCAFVVKTILMVRYHGQNSNLSVFQ